jgi:hypothetical protein
MDNVTPFPHTRNAGIDLDLAAQCGAPAESPAPAKHALPPNKLAAAVKAGISNPPSAVPTVPDHGFQWASDFCQQPTEPTYLIRGVLDLESTSFMFGDSEAGKSFVAIDRACHVAHGMRWLGKKTKKGIVLYVAGEGKAGLAKRVKAWHEYHGLNLSDALIALRTVPAALCDPKAVTQLISHIQQFVEGMTEKPVLIELDTLAKNFGAGYDENSPKDMAAFVAGMDALKRATGAAVSVIHHPGHGNKDRGAGSKNLPAGVDFSFKVEKSGKSVDDFVTTMTFEKVKDGEKPKPVSWKWQRQTLPWVEQDDDDCWVPVNSIVLVPTQAAPSTRSTKLTRPQQTALDALTAIIPNGDNHALIADWRNAAIEAGITLSESRQGKHAAFNRAVDALVDAGQVKVDGPRCYPAGLQQASTNEFVDNVDGDVDATSPLSNRQQASTSANVDGNVDAETHVDGQQCSQPLQQASTSASTTEIPEFVDAETQASTRQQASTKSKHVDNVDAGKEAQASTPSTHSFRSVDVLTVDAEPQPVTHDRKGLVCTWNDLNRLITKCGNPNPTADGSGCATCGEVKTKTGGRKDELSGASL